MKHSALDLDILALAVASGDLTVSQFAQRLGAREHSVRYALRRLEEAGELKRWVFVDRQRIGFTAYNLYFNIPRPAVERVKKFIIAHPYVQWFGEVVGERRFEATVWVRAPHELTQFFNRLGEVTSAQLTDRIVAIEGDTWHWGHRFFSERVKSASPILLSHDQRRGPGERTTVALDTLDIDIINARRAPETWETAKIARALGVAGTTISYRLKKLYDAGILFDSYLVDRRFDVIHEGHLLLEMKALTSSHLRQLVDICQKMPAVGGIIRGDGGWDYKIVMFEGDMGRLLKAEDALRESLHGIMYGAKFITRRSLLKTVAPLPHP